ncbi:methyl-accepting chemotaxis protein [Paenibacillus sp. ACRSA]|uniref:methyl-accepting chemotaxis protein n=1 Tax=Paenibacillus sp. ACRSA TaxID=2918211 RepID=UPI001EF66357|nr:methyl-accepting chemotaxis protein [Paenibacillus sp. ACRSA]MCG7377200.1 methyl-accepting chemotaxis protein [Paenibacillus sp. ACRSA]
MPMLLEAIPLDLSEQDSHVQENITQMKEVQKSENTLLKHPLSIRDYCREVPVVHVHTTCGEAASMLNANEAYPCIVMCDEQMKPLGLLMRETLYRLLNGRFAADLFYRKAVQHVVDSLPVIVDVSADAPSIIDIALKRQEQHFYDCILVTEEDKLLGVLTMRDMMFLSRKLQHQASEERIRTITESRQEIARINESVTSLVQAAGQAGEEAQRIMHLSEDGERSLTQVEMSYQRVYRHMEGQRQHTNVMLDSIQTGAGMASSIRSLADQSALLAMNASIEAAHAGEYGRGFQVVAGEIRLLAKQTREVAGNMSSLLEGIGDLTKQTVESIRASAAEIDDSSSHVTAGELAFRELNSAVAGMSRVAEGIASEGERAADMALHIRTQLKEMAHSD